MMHAAKRGITLIEVLVAMFIVSIFAIMLGSIFSTVNSLAVKQRANAILFSEGRWATEFMVKELRCSTITGSPGWARISINPSGDRVDFGIDTDADNSADTRVRYYLNGTSLRRRSRSAGPWQEAELARNVSSLNFSLSSNMLTVQSTLTSSNITITLRSGTKIRN